MLPLAASNCWPQSSAQVWQKKSMPPVKGVRKSTWQTSSGCWRACSSRTLTSARKSCRPSGIRWTVKRVSMLSFARKSGPRWLPRCQ